MAYNSTYEVRAHGLIDLTVLAEALEGLTGYEFYNQRGTLRAYRFPWYEHGEHMAKLAAQYPDVTFCVTRYGEDTDDVWRYFYRHGHEPIAQRARLTFDAAPGWAEPPGGAP